MSPLFHVEELQPLNAELESCDAAQRVARALTLFKPNIFVSSSFGVQAAVTLHLVTQAWPEIPVVLIDTGYLFPETYLFADALTERLHLNLHIYRSPVSPAWQEARHGHLWEQGVQGIERYNQMNKVEPMQRAIRDLGAKAWITGLRRDQSDMRKTLNVLARQGDFIKVHPIIDWTDRDVFLYLQRHQLPYHPLWEKGYVSVGDVHTTQPVGQDGDTSKTRFFGLKRECGLHEMNPLPSPQADNHQSKGK